MDLFNLKSNDVKDFKRFMDMKAPAFGGPNETENFEKSKRKSLKEWTRLAKRDANFENGGKNHNYDDYWKAFNSDVPSRAADVKIEEPLKAIPTMGVKIVKESHVPQFENYIFEEDDDQDEIDEMPEIDEEALEAFIEEFGDEVKEILEIACEKMEIEKDECVAIFKEAIQRISEMPEEDEPIEDDEDKDEE